MNSYLSKLALVAALVLSSILASHADKQQVYVVYLGGNEHRGRTAQEIEHIHHSYLRSVKGSLREAKSSILYSYSKAINGFSAFLTPEEAKRISEMDGVTSVFKDKAGKLQTSRSWDFMSLLEADGNPEHADGLNELLIKANFGMDIVVGVLDTGIWPESESFADDGMAPIPSSWKGICQTGEEFNESHCNRKIVGARYYVSGYEAALGQPISPWEYRSPRDSDNHGTHVSSTLGGRRVANASTREMLFRNIKGGAPFVRLAVYKVCWAFGCYDSDMLAAIDDAISDGVDVLSASVVWSPATPFNQDPLVIGALRAAEHNIVAVLAAGNNGPRERTVSNTAPWAITVGAGTIDRVYGSPLLVTDRSDQQPAIHFQAIAHANHPYGISSSDLVYAGDIEIPGSTTTETTGKCRSNTLLHQDWSLVTVLCMEAGLEQMLEVNRAGGFVALMRNESDDGIGELTLRFPLPHPAITRPDEADAILKSIRTTQFPRAVFNQNMPLSGTKQGPHAPIIADFSSRGPSQIEPNILKPDVIAPGQYIVAAGTRGTFYIDSGTSMATPHVAAVAALVKAVHPTWSEAAIRSAIMTTARVTNNVGGKLVINNQLDLGNPFDYGSGHIQPSKAAYPGLVYDANFNDYINFVCSSSNTTLGPLPCPASPVPVTDLNYPSVAVANVQGPVTVTRSVTNVGSSADVTYSVSVDPPTGYRVQITPEQLQFSESEPTLSFSIVIEPVSGAERPVHAFGSYTWTDGVHQVRSPIAVTAGNSIRTALRAELRAST